MWLPFCNHSRNSRRQLRHDGDRTRYNDRKRRDKKGGSEESEAHGSPLSGDEKSETKMERTDVSSKKKKSLPPPPPGFIHAKPRKTSEEEIEAARQRFLARKAAGLTKPTIVLSDDEI